MYRLIIDSLVKKVLLIIWYLSIVYFISISVIFLNDKFIIHHYRQAQTALTTQNFIFQGWSWDYHTPFMGYPWAVPMEFPIFQFLSYILNCLTGLDIIVCGKFLNIAAHVTNNLLISRTSRVLGINPLGILIGMILYNLLPYYIVFDNLYLPDSLTLTFSFLATYFFVQYVYLQNGYLTGLLFFLFSMLTGLSKSTTFLGVLVPIIFILGFLSTKKNNWFKALIFQLKLPSNKILLSCIYFFISGLVAYWWIKHSDSIKVQNPLSAQWVSSNSSFSEWNYGTLSQRLSNLNWLLYFRYSFIYHPLTYLILFLSFVMNLVINRGKFSSPIFGFLLFFFLPPLIFFNLFIVHNYYSIANTIFMYLSIGIVFANLIQNSNYLIKVIGHTILLSIILFGFYRTVVFQDLVAKQGKEPGVYDLLDKVTFKPAYNDVILVVGPSRSPYLQYHFKCRGVNLSENEYMQFGYDDRLKNLVRGFPVKMICIISKNPLNHLPDIYSSILLNISNHITLLDSSESNMYYNFFWDN